MIERDGRGRRFREGGPLRVMLVAGALALAVPVIGTGALLAGAQTSTATATATPEACPPATPTGGAAADDCVVIGEFDIFFKPNLITLPADTAVRVVLANRGEATHNFSVTDHGNSGVENLNVSVTTDAGASGEATIDAPEGRYYFFCDQPGHEQAGMRGYLTVEKDAAIETAEATVTPPAG